jgi:hypothetical protein
VIGKGNYYLKQTTDCKEILATLDSCHAVS